MKWDELHAFEQKHSGPDRYSEEFDFVSALICQFLLNAEEESVRLSRLSDVFESLGIAEENKKSRSPLSEGPEKVTTEIAQQLRELRDRLLAQYQGDVSLPFSGVLELIANRLSLSWVEQRLLMLLMLAGRDQRFCTLLNEIKLNTTHQGIRLLARVLGAKTSQITEALAANANLGRLRLLDTCTTVIDLGDLVSSGKVLDELLKLFHEDGARDEVLLDRLMRAICPLAPRSSLSLEHFQGYGDLQLMRDYLARNRGGLNILLYGPPGTGKTELARVLAQSMGKTLYEVPTQTRNREPITGNDRLNSAQAAQVFLADHEDVLLLFDEMEDAFRNERTLAKAWINQHLEKNPVPTIWISNRIKDVDPAFLRRFDLIQEIRGQENKKLHSELHDRLQQLPVPQQWLDSVVSQQWASPALLNNLCELGSLLPDNKPHRNQHRLEQAVTEKLRPLTEKGRPVLGKTEHATSPLRRGVPAFRLEWLNTHPSLRTMTHLLQDANSARLCLYGPPGTGKTAFARHMAETLGRPFKLASGSDLLSKYVGESEEQVSQLFSDAQDQGAVLLIDEADSFLGARGGASQSWEVTLTNEFMVQLDRYQGIVMVTTNRYEHLDRAIMRRFHLKVAFEAMKRQQVISMLKACVTDPDSIDNAEPEQISALSNLTPGLVVNAVEQLNLMRRPLRAQLLLRTALEEQRAQSVTESQPIGFTVPISGTPGD